MVCATRVTISIGGKVTASGSAQDLCVWVTYDLEQSTTDLPAFLEAKAGELDRAYRGANRGIQETRTQPQGQLALEATDGAPDYGRRPAGARTGTPASNGATPAARPDSAPVAAPAQLEQALPPNTTPIVETTPASEPARVPQKLGIRSLAIRSKRPPDDLRELLIMRFAKDSVDDLTRAEAAALLLSLQRGDWSVPEAAHA